VPISRFFSYQDEREYRRRKAREEADAQVAPAPPPATPGGIRAFEPPATQQPQQPVQPQQPSGVLGWVREYLAPAARDAWQDVTGAANRAVTPIERGVQSALGEAGQEVGSWLPSVQGALDTASNTAFARPAAWALGDLAAAYSNESPEARARAERLAMQMLGSQRQPQRPLSYDEAMQQGVVPAGMTRETYVPADVPPDWAQTGMAALGGVARLPFAEPLFRGAAAGVGGTINALRNPNDPRAFEAGMVQGAEAYGNARNWIASVLDVPQRLTTTPMLGRFWQTVTGELPVGEYARSTVWQGLKAAGTLGPAALFVPPQVWQYVDAEEVLRAPRRAIERAKALFDRDVEAQRTSHWAWDFVSEMGDPVEIAEFATTGMHGAIPTMVNVLDDGAFFLALATTNTDADMASMIAAQAAYAGLGVVSQQATAGLQMRDVVRTAGTNPRARALDYLDRNAQNLAQEIGGTPEEVQALARSFLYNQPMPATNVSAPNRAHLATTMRSVYDAALSQNLAAKHLIQQMDPQMGWVGRLVSRWNNTNLRTMPAEAKAQVAREMGDVQQIPATPEAVQAWHDAQDANPSLLGRMMQSVTGGVQSFVADEAGELRRPGEPEKYGPEPEVRQPSAERYREAYWRVRAIENELRGMDRADPRARDLYNEAAGLEREIAFHKPAADAEAAEEIARAREARNVPQEVSLPQTPQPVNQMTANAADLAADYKARGMDRFRAWDQFVIDRALKPDIDAKTFYATYDRVTASRLPTPVSREPVRPEAAYGPEPQLQRATESPEPRPVAERVRPADLWPVEPDRVPEPEVREATGEAAATQATEDVGGRPQGFSTAPDARAWEVSETDYISRWQQQQARRFEGAIRVESKTLEAMRPNNKGRPALEAKLRLWQEQLDALRQGLRPDQVQKARQDYLATVKKAISSGEPVPQAVIDQYAEFTKAATARERYEKGRHTSFANRSVAINDAMQEARGYKVKRQDGKAITEEQVAEIDQAVREIEELFGPQDQVFRDADLTIAHTSGKHPFLRTSGGVYHPSERTVTIGVQSVVNGDPIRAFAHEWAHMVDAESGARLGYEGVTRRGDKLVKGPWVSEYDAHPLYHQASPEQQAWQNLMEQARRRMNRVASIRRAFQAEADNATEAQRAEREFIRVALGPYWGQNVEVWARLVEQLVSTRRGQDGVSVSGDLTAAPGYWSAEDFAAMRPEVERQLQRRLDVLRPTTTQGTPATPTAEPQREAVPAEPLRPQPEQRQQAETVAAEPVAAPLSRAEWMALTQELAKPARKSRAARIREAQSDPLVVQLQSQIAEIEARARRTGWFGTMAADKKRLQRELGYAQQVASETPLVELRDRYASSRWSNYALGLTEGTRAMAEQVAEAARAAGEPVPAEVLRDYPDLAPPVRETPVEVRATEVEPAAPPEVTFTKDTTTAGRKQFEARLGEYDQGYTELTIRQAFKGDNGSWEVVNSGYRDGSGIRAEEVLRRGLTRAEAKKVATDYLNRVTEREAGGFLLFRQTDAPIVTPDNAVLTPNTEELKRARTRKMPPNPDRLIPVEFRSQRGWSDGYMMDLGDPPYKAELPAMQKFATLEATDANHTVRPDSDLGEPVRWLGFKDDTSSVLVGVLPDGTPVGLNPGYWAYFAKKYKDAEFLAHSGTEPVIVRSGGEVVGVVMPMYIQRDDAASALYTKFGVRQEPAPEPVSEEPAVEAASEPTVRQRKPRYKAADDEQAIRTVEQDLAAALRDTAESVYIPPQMTVEVNGREYSVMTNDVLRKIGAVSTDLNKWRLPATFTPTDLLPRPIVDIIAKAQAKMDAARQKQTDAEQVTWTASTPQSREYQTYQAIKELADAERVGRTYRLATETGLLDVENRGTSVSPQVVVTFTPERVANMRLPLDEPADTRVLAMLDKAERKPADETGTRRWTASTPESGEYAAYQAVREAEQAGRATRAGRYLRLQTERGTLAVINTGTLDAPRVEVTVEPDGTSIKVGETAEPAGIRRATKRTVSVDDEIRRVEAELPTVEGIDLVLARQELQALRDAKRRGVTQYEKVDPAPEGWNTTTVNNEPFYTRRDLKPGEINARYERLKAWESRTVETPEPQSPDTPPMDRVPTAEELAPVERAIEDAAQEAVETGQVSEAGGGDDAYTFRTEGGSTYRVVGETTTRDKALHKYHDPHDVGPKPQSARTVYVSPDLAREVGMWNMSSGTQKQVLLDGDRVVLLSQVGDKLGRDGTTSDPTFTRTPEIGRSPLELWDQNERGGYRNNHPGSPIVSIERTAPRPQAASGGMEPPEEPARTYSAHNSAHRVSADVDTAGNVTLRQGKDVVATFPLSEWPRKVAERIPFLASRIPASVQNKVPTGAWSNLINKAAKRAQAGAQPVTPSVTPQAGGGGMQPPVTPPTRPVAPSGPPSGPTGGQQAGGQQPPSGRNLVRESRQPDPAQRTAWSERVTRFRTRYLNRFHRFWQLQQKTGVPVEWSAERVDAAVRLGESLIMRGRMGEPGAKGLVEVLQPIEQHWDDFWDYMQIRRMQGIRAANPAAKLPLGIADPDAELRAFRARVGQDTYDLIARTADEARDVIKTLGVDEGVRGDLLSQESADRIANKYRTPEDIAQGRPAFYIPMLREGFDFNELTQRPSGRRVADAPDIFYKRMNEDGSVRRIKDPAQALYHNIVAQQLLIARNQTAKLFHEALRRASPQLLYEGNMDKAPDGWEVIRYKRAGETVEFAVPPEWGATAKGLEAYQLGVIEKALRTISRPLVTGAIGQNIEYPLRNLLKDGPTLWLREGVAPLISKTWWEGILAAFTKNDAYHRAAQAQALAGTLTEQFSMKSMLEQAKTRQGVGIKVKSFGDLARWAWNFLPNVSENIEIGSKVAAFLKLEKQGIKGFELSHRTMNATGNWGRAGTVTRVVNAVSPFFNVPIQATSLFARTVAENPQQALLRLLPLLLGAGLLAWHNKTFETYELLPDYEKAANWVFMVGDGEEEPDPRYPGQAPKPYPIALTVPKSEQLVPLLTLVDIVLDQAWKDGDHTFGELLLDGVVDGLIGMTPLDSGMSRFMTPVLGTGVQLAMNRDVFRDQDIVPQSEENRPPEYQYDDRASSVSVEVGRVLGVSPRQIDFAVSDVAGTGANQLMWLLGTIIDGVRERETPGSARRQPLSRVEQLANVPGIRTFLTTRNTQPLREGYANLDKAERAAQDTMYAIPEFRRFGKGVSAPSATASINGVPYELTPEQRIEILETATPIRAALTREFIASPDYQEMNDLQRSREFDRISSRASEQARAYVLAGLEGTVEAQEFIPSRIREQYAEYEKIPAYTGIRYNPKTGRYQVLALTEQQADRIAYVRGVVSDMRATYKDMTGRTLNERQALAYYAQWRGDIEGAALSLIETRKNPERDYYWETHPELADYYDKTEPDDINILTDEPYVSPITKWAQAYV
jgi:hypothetical protein